jgi:hypothetical protein
MAGMPNTVNGLLLHPFAVLLAPKWGCHHIRQAVPQQNSDNAGKQCDKRGDDNRSFREFHGVSSFKFESHSMISSTTEVFSS